MAPPVLGPMVYVEKNWMRDAQTRACLPARWTPGGRRIHHTAAVNDSSMGFRSAHGSAPRPLVPIVILL